VRLFYSHTMEERGSLGRKWMEKRKGEGPSGRKRKKGEEESSRLSLGRKELTKGGEKVKKKGEK